MYGSVLRSYHPHRNTIEGFAFFFSYMAVYSRLQAPHRPLILIRFILLNKLYIRFIWSLFNIFIKQKNTMKKYFFACDESHPLESDSCAH